MCALESHTMAGTKQPSPCMMSLWVTQECVWISWRRAHCPRSKSDRKIGRSKFSNLPAAFMATRSRMRRERKVGKLCLMHMRSSKLPVLKTTKETLNSGQTKSNATWGWLRCAELLINLRWPSLREWRMIQSSLRTVKVIIHPYISITLSLEIAVQEISMSNMQLARNVYLRWHSIKSSQKGQEQESYHHWLWLDSILAQESGKHCNVDLKYCNEDLRGPDTISTYGLSWRSFAELGSLFEAGTGPAMSFKGFEWIVTYANFFLKIGLHPADKPARFKSCTDLHHHRLSSFMIRCCTFCQRHTCYTAAQLLTLRAWLLLIRYLAPALSVLQW